MRAHRPSLGACLALVLGFAAALGFARPASACGPYPPPRALSPEEKTRAQKLFQEGRSFEGEGQWKPALDRYLASRELVPRKSNTKNAAVCLDKLGRASEALPLYEEVLGRFRSELTLEERAALLDDVRRLKSKVATLRLDGGEGYLVVDGKKLGALPRPCPLYLPPGPHSVRVNERIVLVSRELEPGESLTLRIVEFREPLPPTRPEGWFLQAFGGPALGSSMDSNAERDALGNCGGACPFATGVLAGARGGYFTANNVSFELFTGFLSVESTFQRSLVDEVDLGDSVSSIRYTLSHHLSLRGPFMGPAIGYRLDISPRWSAIVRGSLGLVAAQSSDPLTGRGSDDRGHTAVLDITGRSTVLRSTPTFLMPEIGVEAKLGRLRVGVSIAYLLFAAQGDTFEGRAFDARTACMPGNGLSCAPETEAHVTDGAPQTAYGLMQLWIPQLTIGLLP